MLFLPTRLIYCALATITALTLPVRLEARVTHIEMTVEPAASALRHDVPESYRVLRGHITGELDPADAHNTIIQDIALAERNAHGRVEYTATFMLYAPIHPAVNAMLLYEVVNRGKSIMPRDYASGDFFLASGWQGDIPFDGPAIAGGHGETIRVPIARNRDGTPITGPALARFFDLPQGQATLTLRHSATYAQSGVAPLPASLDTQHAELITKSYEDIDGASAGVHSVAASDWAWADCTSVPFPGTPDPAKICLKQAADPALLYELRYTAKDPLVIGVGLAAIRDLVSFFRFSARDDQGVANPIPQPARHSVILGISQSGNLIRSFLNLGFNQDEQNRQVFDGAFPIIAARQAPINVRFGVPGGTSMLYDVGTDGVDWWSSTADEDRHRPTASLLDRCRATGTCPRIFELLGSTEFYSLRASLGFTGTGADRDLPLPDNIRRYYLASTQHGGGSGVLHWSVLDRQRNPDCVLPMNPNPMDPVRRALLLALKQWVGEGREPPASVYPTLAAHTLAPAARVLASFPIIPGAPRPRSAMNPNMNYDLGPEFHYNDLSGAIGRQPAVITGQSPSVLPVVDADGNEVGGIHTVHQQVALGTYLGWNVTARGFRKGQFCGLSGSYLPFAGSEEERKESHDPRLSLEERYGSREEYLRRVEAVAKTLTEGRFLLEDDARKIIDAARSSDVLLH